jgi:hypothetical protein
MRSTAVPLNRLVPVEQRGTHRPCFINRDAQPVEMRDRVIGRDGNPPRLDHLRGRIKRFAQPRPVGLGDGMFTRNHREQVARHHADLVGDVVQRRQRGVASVHPTCATYPSPGKRQPVLVPCRLDRRSRIVELA